MRRMTLTLAYAVISVFLLNTQAHSQTGNLDTETAKDNYISCLKVTYDNYLKFALESTEIDFTDAPQKNLEAVCINEERSYLSALRREKKCDCLCYESVNATTESLKSKAFETAFDYFLEATEDNYDGSETDTIVD